MTSQALITAQQEIRYNSILTSTCGVMFMSVPHDISDVAVFGNRLAIIVNTVTNVNMTYLRDLERDSRTLQDISKAFENLEGFNIATVTESNETRIPSTTKYILVGILWRICRLSLLTDLKVVPAISARLNLGKREVVFSILDSDHLTV